VGLKLLGDLDGFIRDHRPHGPLTADATEPAWNGYLLTVACACGTVFERWVTPLRGRARPHLLGKDQLASGRIDSARYRDATVAINGTASLACDLRRGIRGRARTCRPTVI
jgi:hypothetical protein